VGRLRERERDLAAVEELLGRRSGVLLIEGRAGIGKTSLVEAACSRADELGCELRHAGAIAGVTMVVAARLAAAVLLDRALAEPPPPGQRAGCCGKPPALR
jgi:hypothetical protein